MRRIGMLLAAVAATACTRAVVGNALEESYVLPPEFPDLRRYTPIGEDAPFWHAEGRSIGWFFAGPRNLDCAVDLYKYGRAMCEGKLPDIGPAARELIVTEDDPVTLMVEGHETPASQLPPALPPRHVVRDAKSGVACGVDDAGTLGCQVRGHGFVVTPTKTIVF